MKATKIIMILGIALLAASCTTMTRSMKTPSNYVEFQKEDFEFSGQLTGQATETRVLGIDFARLFTKKYGEVMKYGNVSIPVIGNFVNGAVNYYALYNMMNDNPGYDVVFYPTFESKQMGFLFLFQTTSVTVKARLAKIKE